MVTTFQSRTVSIGLIGYHEHLTATFQNHIASLQRMPAIPMPYFEDLDDFLLAGMLACVAFAGCGW